MEHDDEKRLADAIRRSRRRREWLDAFADILIITGLLLVISAVLTYLTGSFEVARILSLVCLCGLLLIRWQVGR